MRRVLAIHLRSLSIDLAQRRRRRAARRPGAPKTSCILLARSSNGRSLVAARCNEAARRGVRLGLSLAEAQALIDPQVRARHGDPWVEELSEERDLRALHALGQWLMARFSPLVALEPPDGLFVDVAGTERLFGDEEELCRAVLRAMHRLEIGSRLAVADTVGAASAIARFGRTPRQIVPGGDEALALGPLPIAALRLPGATCEALAELGVESVQELLRLDRDRVAARFGGDVAMRLDQALGRAFESVTPLAFESPPQAERVFEGPVSTSREPSAWSPRNSWANSVASSNGRAKASWRQPSCSSRPTYRRDDCRSPSPGPALTRGTSGPCSGPASSPCTSASASSGSASSRSGPGASLPNRSEPGSLRRRPAPPRLKPLDRHVGELVDVLAARLGPENVLAARAEPSLLPERSYSWIRPQEHRARGASKPRHMPRPSLLFSPPEPATFENPGETEELPGRLRWRGIAYRIRRARGPERLARPWWDDSPAWPDGSPHTVRDYYRLETSCGRSLWAFREPKHGRAFIQGEWT